MKTSKELLEKNGWKEYDRNVNFRNKYYWKDTYYCSIWIVALNGNMNNVVIDTTEFDSEVEPNFLRKVLKEVEKIEVKNNDIERNITID